MRGALPRMTVGDDDDGIIPAYAGSTTPRMPQIVGTEDHPRVCGEHTTLATTLAALAGSSPRMRGAQTRLESIASSGGIIPAYAGSTVAIDVGRDHARDHPRVCGEH